MERIVSHYTGNTNLDFEALRNLAEFVDKGHNGPQPPDVQSHGSDDLGMDDENFTVEPLENNITREVQSSQADS